MYHKKIKHLNVRIKCVLFIICGLLVSNSHNVYATDDLSFIEGEQNIQKRDLEDLLRYIRIGTTVLRALSLVNS